MLLTQKLLLAVPLSKMSARSTASTIATIDTTSRHANGDSSKPGQVESRDLKLALPVWPLQSSTSQQQRPRCRPSCPQLRSRGHRNGSAELSSEHVESGFAPHVCPLLELKILQEPIQLWAGIHEVGQRLELRDANKARLCLLLVRVVEGKVAELGFDAKLYFTQLFYDSTLLEKQNFSGKPKKFRPPT